MPTSTSLNFLSGLSGSSYALLNGLPLCGLIKFLPLRLLFLRGDSSSIYSRPAGCSLCLSRSLSGLKLPSRLGLTEGLLIFVGLLLGLRSPFLSHDLRIIAYIELWNCSKVTLSSFSSSQSRTCERAVSLNICSQNSRSILHRWLFSDEWKTFYRSDRLTCPSLSVSMILNALRIYDVLTKALRSRQAATKSWKSISPSPSTSHSSMMQSQSI